MNFAQEKEFEKVITNFTKVIEINPRDYIEYLNPVKAKGCLKDNQYFQYLNNYKTLVQIF